METDTSKDEHVEKIKMDEKLVETKETNDLPVYMIHHVWTENKNRKKSLFFSLITSPAPLVVGPKLSNQWLRLNCI